MQIPIIASIHSARCKHGQLGPWLICTLALMLPAQAQEAAATVQILDPVATDSANFGSTLAIDGNRLAVGQSIPGQVPNVEGHVELFESTEGIWSSVAQLSLGPDRVHGHGLDLQGSTLVASAATNSDLYSGEVQVFTETAIGWTRTAVLAPADLGPADRFGFEVALEGEWLAVAAIGQLADPAYGFGVVYLYRNQGPDWVLTEKLLHTNGAPTSFSFGQAIAIEDRTMLIGALGDFLAASPGFVSSYAFDGLEWTEEAPIPLPWASPFNAFGSSSIDIVGSSAFVMAGTGILMYERTGAAWTQVDSLTPDPGEQFSNNLTSDGDRLLIASRKFLLPGYLRAQLLHRSGPTWTETSVAGAPSTSFSPALRPGIALADRQVIVASPFANQGQGRVRIFERIDAPALNYCTGKLNSGGCVPSIAQPVILNGILSLDDPAPFQITASEVRNQSPGTLLYGLQGPAAIPFADGTLCVAPPVKRTSFQQSGGNFGYTDCSGQYTFEFDTFIAGGTDPELQAGLSVHAQYWQLDTPSSGPPTAGLTDAVEFRISL